LWVTVPHYSLLEVPLPLAWLLLTWVGGWSVQGYGFSVIVLFLVCYSCLNGGLEYVLFSWFWFVDHSNPVNGFVVFCDDREPFMVFAFLDGSYFSSVRFTGK
jgi:hypothetical protein